MEPINLIEFIERKQQFMADKSKYNPNNRDKIKPFLNISSFLQTGLNEQELTLVTAQLTLLRKTIVEQESYEIEGPEEPDDFDDSEDVEEVKEDEESEVDNSDFIRRRIEDSCFHLFVNYLLMLEINKEAILGITDSNVLYLITNAMRTVPYAKYDEAIRKLLYPALIDAVTATIAKEKGITHETKGIINILTDMIISDDKPFEEEQLNEYMNKFLLTKAYDTLCIPDNIVGERRMQIEITVNKFSILNAIKGAARIGSAIAPKPNEKQEVMSFYDCEMSDKTKAMINIAFYRKLKAEKVQPFQSANLRLILLILGQMMDINAMDQEQLFALVKKLEEEDVPQSEYGKYLKNDRIY